MHNMSYNIWKLKPEQLKLENIEKIKQVWLIIVTNPQRKKVDYLLRSSNNNWMLSLAKHKVF